MYPKERTDRIMEILRKNGYVTVKYLVEILHYSNATINRDLNILENLNLIKRSYGGAELAEITSIPLEFRYQKMKSVKRKLAKFAAEIIDDGDTVLIDGSTTCEGMGAFIAEKKDVTVITNNMLLAENLSEYGVCTICSGGNIVEVPNMLGGEDAVRTAMRYKTDKMFFSTWMFNEIGEIGESSSIYTLFREAAMSNADKVYYLADHSKLNAEAKYTVADFSDISAVITDYVFDNEIKQKFSETIFYEVE